MLEDIDEYRDEHESDEHWALRRAFIERWKDKYPTGRLLCLARVFTNIEFMGCRYPHEVMQEIATLSQDVAKSYRSSKGNKLQRTFVSASDAAEDRAKGVKRKGGVVDEPSSKRISFVAQGHFDSESDKSLDKSNSIIVLDDDSVNDSTNQSNNSMNPIVLDDSDIEIVEKKEEKPIQEEKKEYNYTEEFKTLRWMDVRNFRDNMFYTDFGKLILMVRPWMSKLSNIQYNERESMKLNIKTRGSPLNVVPLPRGVFSSCAACGLEVKNTFANNCMTLTIAGKVVASATGSNKVEARSIVETIVWNRMRNECVVLLVKELFLAKDSEHISNDNVGDNRSRTALDTGFGTPLESSVASKMMKLMGWTGGGLGANEEGISEPIRPHLQQVHRAGLGSGCEITSIHQLRARANDLMRKYKADDTIDVDLVFSADFSKEERAELHQVSRRCGLNSKSYGAGNDRFLVVRKKVDPFTLTRAVVQQGGSTQKYEVYLSSALQRR